MDNPMAWLLLVGAYFLGAIPFGLLLGRVFGAGDIRTQGSGNIGATNVLRTAGKVPAALALLLDMFKGAVPVWAAREWFPTDGAVVIVAAMVTFLGHLYPLYLGFKGGKGVATGLGIFLAWTPASGLIITLVWLLTAFVFRLSSLAALVAFGSLPISLYFFSERNPLIAAALITPYVFWKHRANIVRIWAGTEPRIGKRGQQP